MSTMPVSLRSTTAATSSVASSATQSSYLPTTSPVAPDPSLPPSSSSIYTGAVIGGVVGGVAGVVVLGVAFWYFAIRRNLQQRLQEPGRSSQTNRAGQNPVLQSPHEIPAKQRQPAIGEMNTQTRMQELEGWRGQAR